ncbi:MAG: DUF86 domain-containing protein [Candidatus Nanohalobium sp.]
MEQQTEDRIREKLNLIDSSLDRVDENLPDTFEEFQQLDIEKDGVYKNVKTAIQAAYDICAMIVKAESLGVPEDESGFPDLLAEDDIISSELSESLKDMKGFRNALARRYGSIDDEVAYRNIVEGLGDFEVFRREVREYIKK